MSASIYYFSGTGNSYMIAKTMGENLGVAKLLNIASNKNHVSDRTKIIGVVFPLYYFGLPVIVEEFFTQLEIPSDTYVFIIVTRGHTFAGGAKRQLDKVFSEKDRTYNFFRYITMGDNFPFYMFNPSDKKVSTARNQRAVKRVASIASTIRMRKDSKVFSILDYSPFPAITLRLPRFGYKHFLQIREQDVCFEVDEAICNGCKKCVRACPVGNVRHDTKIEWKHENCQMCLACYNCCPQNAIQYIDPSNKVNTKGKRQHWNFGTGEGGQNSL